MSIWCPRITSQTIKVRQHWAKCLEPSQAMEVKQYGGCHRWQNSFKVRLLEHLIERDTRWISSWILTLDLRLKAFPTPKAIGYILVTAKSLSNHKRYFSLQSLFRCLGRPAINKSIAGDLQEFPQMAKRYCRGGCHFQPSTIHYIIPHEILRNVLQFSITEIGFFFPIPRAARQKGGIGWRQGKVLAWYWIWCVLCSSTYRIKNVFKIYLCFSPPRDPQSWNKRKDAELKGEKSAERETKRTNTKKKQNCAITLENAYIFQIFRIPNHCGMKTFWFLVAWRRPPWLAVNTLLVSFI